MKPTASLFDLTGRVVLVTGSTKGIGRAMAEGCARAGATVVVSSRKQELCDDVAAEIADTTGATAIALPMPLVEPVTSTTRPVRSNSDAVGFMTTPRSSVTDTSGRSLATTVTGYPVRPEARVWRPGVAAAAAVSSGEAFSIGQWLHRCGE